MKASGFYNIRRYSTICAILLLIFAIPVFAQETGTLSGDVKDTDGQPLPGVSVTAAGGGVTKTAYTDTAGKFAISGLKPGTYDITTELSGFVTVTQTDIAIK